MAIRTFLAIPVELTKHAFQVIQQSAALDEQLKLQWVRFNQFHITIHFFGDLDLKTIEYIVSGLAHLNHKIDSFDLRLSHFDTFGNPANILWVGLEPELLLRELYQQISIALQEVGIGLPPKFKPHLTLGRVPTHNKASLPNCKDLLLPNLPRIQARELVLYRSELHPSGHVYTPISKIDFNASE
jgi:2'-5' RNA ligase